MGSSQQPSEPQKHSSANVRPALRPLVRELASLSEEDRHEVVAAAEQTAAGRDGSEPARERRRERWARLRALAGVVNLGGNAVEDCERLYDA